MQVSPSASQGNYASRGEAPGLKMLIKSLEGNLSILSEGYGFSRAEKSGNMSGFSR